MSVPETLAAALAQVQAQLPDVRRTEKAVVKSDKGNYSYTYAGLDQVNVVLPVLAAAGLSWLCKPTLNGDGKFVLAYALLHVSGQSEKGEYPLPTSGTPQQVGSAITYARRYALLSVTGLAPEDDDGAAAAKAPRHPETAQQPEPEPSAEQIDTWLLDFTTRVANAPDKATLRGGLYRELVAKVTAGWITSAEGHDLQAQMAGVAERLDADEAARQAGAA